MKAYFDSIKKEVPEALREVFLDRHDTAVITIDMHDGHLSTDPDCPCPSPRGREIIEPLTVLLAPFAPHIAEELWAALGHTTSVCTADYPVYDEKHLAQSAFEYPVSINGKLRFKKEYATSLTPAQMQADVVTLPEAQKWLEGKTPKKVIVVPGKIINIVI